MKLLYIPHDKNLYRFNLDDCGHPVYIDVARGRHVGVWEPIAYDALPPKVIEELSAKTTTHFGTLPEL